MVHLILYTLIIGEGGESTHSINYFISFFTDFSSANLRRIELLQFPRQGNGLPLTYKFIRGLGTVLLVVPLRVADVFLHISNRESLDRKSYDLLWIQTIWAIEE